MAVFMVLSGALDLYVLVMRMRSVAVVVTVTVTVTEKMNERARENQQERQPREVLEKVSAMLGYQVERRDAEQQSEREAHTPRASARCVSGPRRTLTLLCFVIRRVVHVSGPVKWVATYAREGISS